jgi:hypothetical protein
MDSQVQVHSDGGPCAALLVVSILQVILLGLYGLVAILLGVASVPEIHGNSFDKDSWIVLLALQFILLTVIVSMAVGCALGVYTGVLGMKSKHLHEGIRPVVRSLAAFLKHATPPPMMFSVFPCGTDLLCLLDSIDA